MPYIIFLLNSTELGRVIGTISDNLPGGRHSDVWPGMGCYLFACRWAPKGLSLRAGSIRDKLPEALLPFASSQPSQFLCDRRKFSSFRIWGSCVNSEAIFWFSSSTCTWREVNGHSGDGRITSKFLPVHFLPFFYFIKSMLSTNAEQCAPGRPGGKTRWGKLTFKSTYYLLTFSFRILTYMFIIFAFRGLSI